MEYAGKILMIVENLPVPFDTRVWQEANALSQAGYKVSIICPAGKGYDRKYEVINNISIYRHSLPREGNGVLGYLLEYLAALFWEFVLACRILFREGFDVIHACNPPDDIFLIGAFFKLFGKKFVFDHHDINPELYIAKFGKKGMFYKLMLLLERFTFRLADVSIATNESYKRIAVGRNGMDPDRVFIVRSGPDPARLKIRPPREQIKRGRKYMVGYVGVIGKQEGMDYLLEAMHRICIEKGRQDVFFGIVGGGPYLQTVRDKCRMMGLDEYVEFTGRVSDEIMLDYLNTADVCVNPDEYNEMNNQSTMNKVLEYMALGKPIVQFDLAEGRYSAREASLYANNNDPADLADKILYLLEHEDLRRKMGEYGRNRIEKELQWDITKQNLIKAYERLFREYDSKKRKSWFRLVYQKLFCYLQWYVAIRNKVQGGPLQDMKHFRMLSPPRGHSYADPFLFKKEGKNYLFYEDFRHWENKGVIACREIGSRGEFGKEKVVLERKYHLSYPFVFEWAGEVYMIPETSGNQTIELYRAVQFPERWAFERVMMDRINAADTTLFQYEGRLWMFTHVLAPGKTPDTDLYLFYSDSVEGPWKGHPKNPVVSDIRRARPAGNLFYSQGHLIRPGQDCSVRYGHAVSLNRVTVLTEDAYREEPVKTIEPGWTDGNLCIHTYNFDQDYEAIDGRMPATDFLKLGSKLISRLYRK